MEVGQKILYKNRYRGIVRYVGHLQGKEGEYVGIELYAPRGKNNGSVKGVKYFECPANHGVMAKLEEALESCQIVQSFDNLDVSNANESKLSNSGSFLGNDKSHENLVASDSKSSFDGLDNNSPQKYEQASDISTGQNVVKVNNDADKSVQEKNFDRDQGPVSTGIPPSVIVQGVVYEEKNNNNEIHEATYKKNPEGESSPGGDASQSDTSSSMKNRTRRNASVHLYGDEFKIENTLDNTSNYIDPGSPRSESKGVPNFDGNKERIKSPTHGDEAMLEAAKKLKRKYDEYKAEIYKHNSAINLLLKHSNAEKEKHSKLKSVLEKYEDEDTMKELNEAYEELCKLDDDYFGRVNALKAKIEEFYKNKCSDDIDVYRELNANHVSYEYDLESYIISLNRKYKALSEHIDRLKEYHKSLRFTCESKKEKIRHLEGEESSYEMMLSQKDENWKSISDIRTKLSSLESKLDEALLREDIIRCDTDVLYDIFADYSRTDNIYMLILTLIQSQKISLNCLLKSAESPERRIMVYKILHIYRVYEFLLCGFLKKDESGAKELYMGILSAQNKVKDGELPNYDDLFARLAKLSTVDCKQFITHYLICSKFEGSDQEVTDLDLSNIEEVLHPEIIQPKVDDIMDDLGDLSKLRDYSRNISSSKHDFEPVNYIKRSGVDTNEAYEKSEDRINRLKDTLERFESNRKTLEKQLNELKSNKEQERKESSA